MLCKNCLQTSTYLTKFKIIKSAIKLDFSKLYRTLNKDNLTECLDIKTKYTDEQLALVLKTLNTCNLKEMKTLKISEYHTKVFEGFKKQKSLFKTVEDLLTFTKFAVSELDCICSTICSAKSKRSKSSIVIPSITSKDLEKFNTVVGLRISANSVSWTQLELTGSHCNILKWDCQSVSDLPLNASPAEVIKMGSRIAGTIPIADAYVMEKDGSKPLTTINTSIYRLLLRNQQLISIILTAIAINHQLKRSTESKDNDFFERFFMMKAFAPAKLFDLFVGNETVSSNKVVDSLFEQKHSGLQYISSISSSGEENTVFYESLDLYKKEEINMSLLLAITFFESAVLQTRNDFYKKANNS